MYWTDGRNLQHLTVWPICATQSPRKRSAETREKKEGKAQCIESCFKIPI